MAGVNYDTAIKSIEAQSQTGQGYQNMCRARGRILPDKANLYHQGDEAEVFFRVNSGVVMVYRLLESSQRQISGFYTKGDFFGLSSNGIHQDSAVTVTTSNIAALSMSDVRENIDLQRDLFAMTCSQLEEAQTLITTLTKKTASEKVASFLLMLADRQKRDGESFDIRLPMSRLDIADYLGLTIETVSRRLTSLKSQGIISLPNRDTATVCKYGQLQSLAGV
ncbi:helix-turn-helix domain-containing protein [Litorimonas sp. RW-G-Af-16]